MKLSKNSAISKIIFIIFLSTLFLQVGFATEEVEGKTLIQIVAEAFAGSFGTDWWISFMVFALILIVLYSVLTEIGFFSKEWLHWTVAFLLAAIATSVESVMVGVVALITSYGVGMAMGVFFAALFILGLSKFYRDKADKFEFVMGDQFLTILVVHMPLIFMFALIGGIVGGIGETGTLSAVVDSGFSIAGWSIPAVAIISILTLLIIFFAFKRGRRALMKSTIGKVVLAVFLLLIVLLGSSVPIFGGSLPELDPKTTSQVWGAILGAIVGLGFALLERGRHLQETTSAIEAYSDTIVESQKHIEPLMRDIMIIEERMTKNSSFDRSGRTKLHIKQEIGENIPAGRTIEDLKAIIKAKQETIDDYKMKAGFEAKKASDEAKKNIWTQNNSEV